MTTHGEIMENPLNQLQNSTCHRSIFQRLNTSLEDPDREKRTRSNFLAYALKHVYPVAQIVCGTEDTQKAFTQHFGGLFVSSSYDEFNHKRLFSRQIMCGQENCENSRLLSIIDDIAYDTKASKSESIVKAHKNGSQWFNELLIMGYQSVRDVPESIINAPSKVFVFFEKEDSNRRKLHKHYFKTLIPEYKDFSELMNEICQEHTCLVVDLKKQSSKLEDCVFYFKAPAWKWDNPPIKDKPWHGCPEGWRFGCKQFQEWSDARWDPHAIPDFIQELKQF